MTAWTSDELNKIGKAEELDFQSEREDGSLRDPVTIWVVRVGDDLYIRAIKGRQGWFRGILTRHEGRIEAGGVGKEVSFVEEGDPATNANVDAAYKSKYRGYAANIVNTVLTPEARDTTLKLVPR